MVCDGGATDSDALKRRYGIHYLQIREGDLWVDDTASASIGLRHIVPGGDNSPVFIRLPREDNQNYERWSRCMQCYEDMCNDSASTYVKGQSKLCIYRGW